MQCLLGQADGRPTSSSSQAASAGAAAKAASVAPAAVAEKEEGEDEDATRPVPPDSKAGVVLTKVKDWLSTVKQVEETDEAYCLRMQQQASRGSAPVYEPVSCVFCLCCTCWLPVRVLESVGFQLGRHHRIIVLGSVGFKVIRRWR